MRILRASAAVLMLLLGSVGLAQDAKENRFVAIIGADGVQRAEITGESYSFDPDVIVVKVDVPVELKVKKAGGMTPHGITLKAPEAGINFSVSLGKEPKSITSHPRRSGSTPSGAPNASFF